MNQCDAVLKSQGTYAAPTQVLSRLKNILSSNATKCIGRCRGLPAARLPRLRQGTEKSALLKQSNDSVDAHFCVFDVAADPYLGIGRCFIGI